VTEAERARTSSATAGAQGVQSAPSGAYHASTYTAGSGTSSTTGGSGSTAGGSSGAAVGSQRRTDGQARASATSTAQVPARSAVRRARLRVSNISPWSVFRLSLVLSICLLVVLLVAVAALWYVLNKAGVFTSVIDAASTLTDKTGGGIDKWLGFKRVMTIAAIVGGINVVVITVLSTIGALLYNLCSDFVGGADVTLVER
jgi:hypothetical protein